MIEFSHTEHPYIMEGNGIFWWQLCFPILNPHFYKLQIFFVLFSNSCFHIYTEDILDSFFFTYVINYILIHPKAANSDFIDINAEAMKIEHYSFTDSDYLININF